RPSCFDQGYDEDAPTAVYPRRAPRPAPTPSPAPWVQLDGAGAPAMEAEASAPREKRTADRKAGAAGSAMSEEYRMSEPPPPPARPPLRDEVDDANDWSRPWTPDVPQQQAFDWGASTWLSNDDSMSLASAQRVLWAANEGRSVPAGRIRPHELLNYFTFDTAAPEGDATFEVTASAEAHGDSLSVAFAVQGASPPRQPLDLTLVVDRSGSMRAEGRMEYVKRGLLTMSGQLERGDRLDLVLFDDRVCTPLENYVVGRDDPAILEDVVRRMRPEGGTDLDLGLKEGYDVAKRKVGTHRRNRRVMVLTDAQLNTGDVNPHTVSAIGARFDEDGIRLTGVGVGRDFNDEVLDRLTEKGKGAYVYLGSDAVVDRVFGAGFDGLVQTLAHDVRFRLDLPESLALERFYGEEASTVKEDIQPIHYYAGTSQVFLQDLKMRSGRPPTKDPVKLEVSWRDARTGEPEKRVFSLTVGQMLESDPHNVRKARALMAFSDVMLARSMSGDCEEAYGTFSSRTDGLGDDAEIAYVAGLAQKVCPSVRGEWTTRPVSTSLVDLKVKVDADIAVSGVTASCTSGRVTESLSASSTVARFRVSPGTCRLTLQGVVPMTTTVEVPEVDADVRCLVRGGRLSCDL
ncbi:MAG: VWA domain-containing protein, partial [Myxococcales bacterium]|nr:VWA domain-containing protein [Myxococcales bacterium]